MSSLIDLPSDCSDSDLENCCNGNDIKSNNFQVWSNLWNTSNICQNYYTELLFTGPQGNRIYNPDNLIKVQNNFCDIFFNYTNKFQNNSPTTNNRFVISNPGLPGYNVFQETIHANCIDLPGACDISLRNNNCDKCGLNGANHSINFCQPYTRDQISLNPGILEFCGCFGPSDPDFVTQPQCDPLCTPITTVKLPDGAGSFLECNNSVCVIDNISIQATQSAVGQGATFTQVCANCIGGNQNVPCTCIISGVDIQSTANSIGLNSAEFNQFCGPNSTCLIVNDTNPNEPAQKVNCQNSLSTDNFNPENFSSNNIAILWIAVIGVALIILTILIVLAASSSSKKSKNKFKAAVVEQQGFYTPSGYVTDPNLV